MPLVLRGVVDEIYSGVLFLFFLTYGFMGLEFVCMKLHDPFDENSKLIDVAGMKKVCLVYLFSYFKHHTMNISCSLQMY